MGALKTGDVSSRGIEGLYYALGRSDHEEDDRKDDSNSHNVYLLFWFCTTNMIH